jgi:hypothetical protein
MVAGAAGGLGWVRVQRVGGPVVKSAPNVLTQRMLSGMLYLLRQSDADDVASRRVGSFWFEADNATMPAPTTTDDGPHSASTVIEQVEIDPDDVTISTVQTSAGPMTALNFRARLYGDDHDGRTIHAVGLYSYGDGTLPDPDTYVAGTNGVYLLARQAQTLPISAGAAWDFTWTIVIGLMPSDVVIEES